MALSFFFFLYICSLETGFGVSQKERLHNLKPGEDCWLQSRESIHGPVQMNLM